MILRLSLIVFLLLSFVDNAFAQSSEEDVYSVVESFFEALRTADTELMESILLPDGQAHAIMPTDSTTSIRRMTHSQTLESMPNWTQPVFERMWDPTILINGPLAVVWGPYDLYVGETYSHCGVDTFTLLETDDGWMISSIDYTIERGTCQMHPEGPPDFDSLSDG